MATATLDSKVLEQRLVTKESTIGGASVFRIAKSLREYHTALSQDPVDEENVQRAYETYSRDVLLFQMEISKMSKIFSLCDSEIESYNAQEDDIECEIKATQQKLIALEKELELQKQIRGLTTECEAKALLVNELPTPNHLKRQIEECDTTVGNLESLTATTDEKIAKRAKQFDDLMAAIKVLSDPLVDSGSVEGGPGDADEVDDEDADAADEGGGANSKSKSDRRQSRIADSELAGLESEDISECVDSAEQEDPEEDDGGEGAADADNMETES